MEKYTVHISEEARDDIRELGDVIDYKLPLTAIRYTQGLLYVINTLRISAESLSRQTRASLQQHGTNVHRINYKKMAIIYTIHGKLVYIHRIIPASMIIEL